MKRLSIPGEVFLTSPQEFCNDILTCAQNKSVAVFLTSSAAERLSLQNWLQQLSKIADVTHIGAIPSNPTYEDVFAALEQCKGKGIQLAVAIGGGSVIDMAKACIGLHGLLKRDILTQQDVLQSIKSGAYRAEPVDIPIIAVPTTSGTGSEVTRWATVWDMQGKAKYSVEAPHLCPRTAFIVPQFTCKMPKRLTLSTGLDALCQAVEAYWAKATNPMVQELSKAAIRLIVTHLPKALQDGSDVHTREKLALGSLFSGMAFSNTKTTACHSMSYPLTMLFGIEHGLACIITMPKVMELNMPAINEPQALFEALGVKSVAELQAWLDAVCGDIVSLRLSSFGVKQEDIEKLASLSFTLGRMDNNPVAIDQNAVEEILTSLL